MSEVLEMVEVGVRVVHATSTAVLLTHENSPAVWIPRSLIENGHWLQSGDDDIISMRQWKAEQLGWS